MRHLCGLKEKKLVNFPGDLILYDTSAEPLCRPFGTYSYNVKDAVSYSLDIKKCTFTSVSQNSDKLLGFRSNLLLRKGPAWFTERIHPEDIKRIHKKYDLFASEKDILEEVKYRFLTSKDRYIWLIDRRTIIYVDNEPLGILGLITRC